MNNDQQWKDKLTPEEYRICREKGTEAPFSGEYYHNHETGNYRCKCCGEVLFESSDKYDSGSGWPSFDRPASEQVIHYEEDGSLGMSRVEVSCDLLILRIARLSGRRRWPAEGRQTEHLFPDGP